MTKPSKDGNGKPRVLEVCDILITDPVEGCKIAGPP